MASNLWCMSLLLMGALAVSACGSSLPETYSGTRTRVAYPSLDQKPVRAGGTVLLKAPVSSRILIGPYTTANVVAQVASDHAPPDDPSGLIGAGAVGMSSTGFVVGSAGFVMLGTNMIVAGPLMLPYAFEEADKAADQTTITENVIAFGFLGRLEEDLSRTLHRLRSMIPESVADRFVVELRVERYGLAREGVDDVPCFTFKGVLEAREDTQIHYREPIVWSSKLRSEDLPPVRCASLDEMARNDGALAREILREATIILSAAIVGRLSGRS